MRLNTHVDEILEAKVRGKVYPVSVAGNGIPCLAIGLGTLMQRTLSSRFKSNFKVYSSDLYWDKRYKLNNPTSLTIQQIMEDIAELGTSLDLYEYVLFGHSAYGIVALEFAKLYPSFIKGIIMVGTPLNSNPEVAKWNNEYFMSYADSKRKQIDAERQAAFIKENQTQLDFSARFLRQYIWRDAPRYWHIPDFDCTSLWNNIIVDDVIDHFFAEILPNVNVKKNLEKIDSPIFLAAGMSDYDCCPWVWSEVDNLPRKMTIQRFTKSGHYPNYEEESAFDEAIVSWAKNSINYSD